jgi:hypothetical protein
VLSVNPEHETPQEHQDKFGVRNILVGAKLKNTGRVLFEFESIKYGIQKKLSQREKC